MGYSSILANMVWTYFWVTSPFVLVLMIYCCYNVPVGAAHSSRGGFSIFLLAGSVWMIVFFQPGLYEPNAQGYGRSSQFYRNTELGVVTMAFSGFAIVFWSLIVFLQWITWIIKNCLIK